MTSLTDKMEKLRRPESYYQHHWCFINHGIDQCIALAKAEEAVVGDWEAEFEKRFDHIVASQGGFIVGRRGSNFDNCATGLDGIKDFITTLLAAKDRERENAVTETLQEMMDWAMDNGITDEKSFCALRDYLTEKALPLTK